MSRVGEQSIIIPDKVEITVEGNLVKAKGPLGELEVNVPSALQINKEEKNLNLNPAKKKMTRHTKAMWGLYRSLLANAVHGVNEGFEKTLEIEGVGYNAQVSEDKLILNVGYSHSIEMQTPEDIQVEVEGNKIKVKGVNRQKVGQFAADVRAKKKPEPYKGKGIKYEGEQIRMKAGKKASGTEG